MDKQKALREIISKLEEDLRIVTEATRAAYEAATHEESKAEDQYDTRGIEASYLANAQAQRSTEIERMLHGLKIFIPPNFTNTSAVAAGALIELLQDKKKIYVFLLPFGAGVHVEQDGNQISVITPSSPLGQELLDRDVGDVFKVSGKGSFKTYEIRSIC
jgi:transcription elongation GreA/GreB family factor